MRFIFNWVGSNRGDEHLFFGAHDFSAKNHGGNSTKRTGENACREWRGRSASAVGSDDVQIHRHINGELGNLKRPGIIGRAGTVKMKRVRASGKGVQHQVITIAIRIVIGAGRKSLIAVICKSDGECRARRFAVGSKICDRHPINRRE